MPSHIFPDYISSAYKILGFYSLLDLKILFEKQIKILILSKVESKSHIRKKGKTPS